MPAEVVISPLPYGMIIDRRGDIRMSSNTALVTDATIHLREKLLASDPSADVKIFIAGENTFGPDFPASSDKMKDQMVRKGIPPESIEVVRNSNNTEEQIRDISNRTSDPVIVALGFHAHRTDLLAMEQNLSGPFVAEDFIVEAHAGATRTQLRKLTLTKVKIGPVSKIRLAELIATAGVYLGKPGKAIVRELKRRQGEGSAIADYHVVEQGSVHLEKAMKDPVKRARLEQQRITA